MEALHNTKQYDCRDKETCSQQNLIYRAIVKTNSSVKQYICATEGTIKKEYITTNFPSLAENIQRFLIQTYMAPRRHEHLTHHHLGNTKTSIFASTRSWQLSLTYHKTPS